MADSNESLVERFTISKTINALLSSDCRDKIRTYEA